MFFWTLEPMLRNTKFSGEVKLYFKISVWFKTAPHAFILHFWLYFRNFATDCQVKYFENVLSNATKFKSNMAENSRLPSKISFIDGQLIVEILLQSRVSLDISAILSSICLCKCILEKSIFKCYQNSHKLQYSIQSILMQ